MKDFRVKHGNDISQIIRYKTKNDAEEYLRLLIFDKVKFSKIIS